MKKAWIYIKLSLYIVLITLTLVFKDYFLINLRYLVGGIMVIYSIEEIIKSLIYSRKVFYFNHKFLQSVFELILGVVTLFFIDSHEMDDQGYKTICVIWAVWALLREDNEIREGIFIFKRKRIGLLNLLESFVGIVLAVDLLIEPGSEKAIHHIDLLCVELIFAAGLPVILAISDKVEEEKKKHYQ